MGLMEELNILIATAILLTTAVSPFSAAINILHDTLTTSRPLYDGETLVSPGGTFALGFFNPTNSSSGNRYVAIWYHNISSHDIVWVANNRNPVTGSAGSLALARNGTLLILNHNSTIIWSSSPFTTTTDPTAQLLDTGNIIVRDAAADSSNYIWQSFDYPSNTILLGMFIGWNLRTGINHNITSWSSPNDPSPGAYTAGIHLRGVPQLMVTEGNDSVYWRGGPWLGDRFAGVPEVPSRNVINITFVRTTEEVGYFSKLIGSNVVTRFTANANGSAQRWVWIDPPGQWRVFWKTPKDQCDAFSPCGAFGVCDADETPVCSCVPRFRAKDPARWVLRDWTSGCVRNTTLDCRTDGFVPVSGVKLPDTTAAVADYDGRLGLDDCRVRCLMNCSCTAYSLADVTDGGSGCIMWTGELNDMRFYSEGGQELYVRVAAADAAQLTGSTNSNQKRRNLAVILVPIFASLFIGSLLIGCLISRHILRKKKTRQIVYRDNEEISNDDDINLPLFDFETISVATNNFSDENKLGEGGFGPVYKGIKEDGKEIAVKRLSKSSTQGLDEFKNEVTLIAKLQHRNLILLLGSCIQQQERMLIYEYLPNRSLDTFLFDKAKRVLLNWQLRYRIILGIARGLLYLHQDSIVRVIHRDLKASNILLSQEMEPKISDFGLARIFGEEAKSKTNRVVGTYGYMSPEYAMDGIFSVKSDVFSFGVLILEIISGQKNKGIFSSEFNHLIGEAWSLWEEGNTLQLADTSIVDSFSISEVLRCIKVGLLCIQEYPADRPLMRSVFLMLTSDKEVLPEPKHPGFVARRHSFQADQPSSSKQESFTVNEITLTMPHSR